MPESGRVGVQNPVPGGEVDKTSGARHSPCPKECPDPLRERSGSFLVLPLNLRTPGAQPSRCSQGRTWGPVLG